MYTMEKRENQGMTGTDTGQNPTSSLPRPTSLSLSQVMEEEGT